MLAWQHDIPTHYFATYEFLEEAFRERVGRLLPRFHAGTRVFWRDFQRIYDNPLRGAAEIRGAYITSNPRDCLAFGTPLQVLRAAWLSASQSRAAPPDAPRRVAAQFGLEDHEHQSIRSLSGGETVRLALAKAYLLAGWATRLTIASPFSWLALDRWDHFRRLAESYRARGTPLELFALDGEDTLAPAEADRDPVPPLPFSWRLNHLRLNLGSLVDRLHDRPVRADVVSREEALASPCLLCGDNGQGKSLIAKALAEAVPCSGEAALIGSRGPLRTRLLFQDVLNQTLMRSFGQLMPGPGDNATAEVYDALAADIRRRFPAMDTPLQPLAERRRDPTPPSLLEIKMLLSAVRLADRKAALILDEPDWGLSREAAVAFVKACVATAHALEVPVIMISHKPWWHRMAGSVRRVHKETARSSSAPDRLFRIHIQDATGEAS